MNMEYFQPMRKLTNLGRIKFFIAFALIFCLSLPGCVSPAEFTEKPSLQSESPSAAEVRFPDYVYDPENAWHAYIANAENGYYLPFNYSLYFYDIQSDLLFPLCTKASCLHKDETCDAYIYNRKNWGFNGEGEDFVDDWTSNAVDGKIFYYREHLYMISCNPSRGYALFQYSPEFTDQRQIAWLSDFEAEPRVLPFLGTVSLHRGYAYYLTYLYDIETAWAKPDYQTSCTAWRVKLEENAEPEELFSFDFPIGFSTTLSLEVSDDKVYVIAEHYMLSGRIVKDENGEDVSAAEFAGAFERVYRYDVKERKEELIWSYEGEQPVNLFESEGAIPRVISLGYSFIISDKGDYVYLAGCPEYEGDHWFTKKIASVNLETREGKTLYETPYNSLNQLRSDGQYYYFIEEGKGQTFLTAIDKEGNLVRRYEIPFDEKYKKWQEEHGWPRENWATAEEGLTLQLKAADSRYIVLCAYDNAFQNLSSSMEGYDFHKYNGPITEGIGVINTGDFLSGKDIEIHQIYERTDPFR